MRELGSIKPDFEPYFLMWDSVLFYPDDQTGVVPCYRHKTCGALVRLDDKFPKRVCIVCGLDTALEAKVMGLDAS